MIRYAVVHDGEEYGEFRSLLTFAHALWVLRGLRSSRPEENWRITIV